MNQIIDLMKIPVGNMANIVKAFSKAGAPKYAPLDLHCLTRAINPHVEPGRLEARLTDFTRKYDDIRSSKRPSSSHHEYKKERRSRNESSDDEERYYRDRKSSRKYYD
jgi:hypothetical protein